MSHAPTRCQWTEGVVSQKHSATERCQQGTAYEVHVDHVIVGHVCAAHSVAARWRGWEVRPVVVVTMAGAELTVTVEQLAGEKGPA